MHLILNTLRCFSMIQWLRVFRVFLADIYMGLFSIKCYLMLRNLVPCPSALRLFACASSGRIWAQICSLALTGDILGWLPFSESMLHLCNRL